MEDAWQRLVGEPHFYGGRRRQQPADAQALFDAITIAGLASVRAASRKLLSTRARDAAVDAMRAVVAEALPLAEAAAALKEKTVKGRAPGAKSVKPKNPDRKDSSGATLERP